MYDSVMVNNERILITGVAGFIGFSVTRELLKNSDCLIVGIDNMNDYYDINLKLDRLKILQKNSNFNFVQETISNKAALMGIFEKYKPQTVLHFAAQAGVRHSIEQPDIYIESNVIGFYNMLEACRYHNVEHLIFASSSSVYGANKKTPYSIMDPVDHPVSLYAATKKTDELLAYSYSKLFNIATTGLRFFTVYGPYGRPDMAYFKFTDKLLKGEDIELYNYGKCMRDFTYIDDVVTGIIKVAKKLPERDENGAQYALYNIGNNHPEKLLEFVETLQQELKKAGILPVDYSLNRHIKLVDMQPGDVEVTYADVTELQRDFGYSPTTTLQEGLRAFANWYRNYYLTKGEVMNDSC